MKTQIHASLTAIAAAVLASLALCACADDTVPAGTVPDGTGSASAVVTEETLPAMTAPELAAHLAATCTFTEALSQNDAYLANHAFGFGALAEKLNSYTAYVPAGIIPEEVFVFDVKDTVDVQTIVDRLQAYVAYQTGEYESYAESEVPKLKDPIIVADGNLVVYVISADNAAAAEVVKTVLD